MSFIVVGELLKEKKKKKVKSDKIAQIQKESSFAVEPSEKTAKLDTSQWPLLLKVNTEIPGNMFFFSNI